MAKYLLKPITGTFKEGFILYDEKGQEVYKTQMAKFKLFGASPFEFKNFITGKTEEHKVSKVVTTSENNRNNISGAMLEMMSTKSGFKYDGEKIFNYLHDKGIRIDSHINTGKIGMKYDITFEGKPLAVIANSSPSGKSILSVDRFYDVECEEKDLDLVFLVAFSIARTEQVFYN